MENKFKPKCIYANKDLGYSPTGHITPCCWHNISFNVPYLKDMFTDELHIDNVSSVEEILNSKPWKIFYDMLLNNPDDAPFQCKKYCSVPLENDIEESNVIMVKAK